MAEPRDGIDRLRTVARRLLWGAVACSALPVLAFLGTTLYERLVAPGAGHLAGRPVTVLVLYLAPVGLVLLVLGLAAVLMAWWLGRERGAT